MDLRKNIAALTATTILALLPGIYTAANATAYHRKHRHAPITYTARFWVTGYDLYGITASGAYAGWGVCATDWGVIPRGAYINVQGVGTCRALDTGGAIIGDRIDVWQATAAECYAITGYRTVSWHY